MATSLSFRKRFGTSFFEVDITDNFGRITQRVGSTKMRVIRRQANTVKVAAKRSMKAGRGYKSESEMPPHVALTYNLKRQAWHRMGEDPRLEPKTTHMRVPSRPGTPPHTGRKPLIKKMLFAQKSMGNKHGGAFLTGPIKLPRSKAGPNPVPGLHEHSGTNKTVNNIYAKSHWAKYPQRPYMIPALKRVAPSFAAMWKDQVKPR